MWSDESYNKALQSPFWKAYRRIFFIEEIEQSNILVWLFGAMILVFFYAFSVFVLRGAVTVEAFENNAYTCPPYFLDCGKFYFLSRLPQYSQTTVYITFFAMMLFSVTCIATRRFVYAHLCTVLLFLWELLYFFVLTNWALGNYDYYHIIITSIVLFLPHKLKFARIAWVFLYFCAASVKFHEGWILGTYFTAMKYGMPLFPDSLAPVFTNGVIFLELFMTWLLLSPNRTVQRFALFSFILFHLYSGILVNYRYPVTCMPALIILFGPPFKPMKLPLDKKSIAGWTLLAAFLCLQLIPEFIPGDRKMTLEANKLGLYMFEANHQCISDETVVTFLDTREQRIRHSAVARRRCDPYNYWFRIQEQCKRRPKFITRIEWKFDHSINGGPFYRMIDVEDACQLNYKFLQHNPWIKTPQEGAPIIGYPVKNIYR